MFKIHVLLSRLNNFKAASQKPVLTPLNKTQSVCRTEILIYIKTNTHHSESVVSEHLNPEGYWVKKSFIAQAQVYL